MLSYILWAGIIGLFSWAIYSDVVAREISDLVSLIFILVFPFTHTPFNWFIILNSLFLYFIFLFFWKLRLMGGGDVKLISTSSLFFPPSAQFVYVLNIFLAGGALAFIYLLGKNRCPILARGTTLFTRILRIESWRIQRGGPLPYAVAIAAGFAITVLQT